jgi:hypothetical protein
MSSLTCGICGEEWAVCIPNTMRGGEINLCAKHWEAIKWAQHNALVTLLAEEAE